MRQYILTERAHLMCPNMQFGIKIKVSARYDKNKMQDTLNVLKKAHPFLQSCISKEMETGKLYYYGRENLNIPVLEKDNASFWHEDYNNITKNGWDVFNESLLKIVIYPLDETFVIMFIAHHLLGDGRSILSLACEFADFYVTGKKPIFAEERLITSIDDLPPNSHLSKINKLITGHANRKWKQERHAVSYEEYKKFEKTFLENNPVSYIDDEWDKTITEKILKKCHEENISLNDYLVAKMMCDENTNRVVVAVDIRKYLSNYMTGAMGNYASATALEISGKTSDVWEKARKVSKKLKTNITDSQKLMMILACYLDLEPGLIDVAAISAMGDFESEEGKFVGSIILGYKSRNGYSVTNLGNIENTNIEEGIFIPPASPANIKTMGVLSVNHQLRKCTAVYI